MIHCQNDQGDSPPLGGESTDWFQSDDVDGYVLKDAAEVADLGEMVEAESRF